MKHIILTFIFAFIANIAYSQALDWAKKMGGTNSDVGNSIITDSFGNVYTTGYFEGTVDFDPGVNTFNLTAGGGGDIFISKLDASGNLVWAKRIGGTNSNTDVGNAIKLDVAGNIYITGWFWNTVDFDPSFNTYNLSSAGGSDVFIAKFNGAGNLIWAKSMGGTSSEVVNAITLDTLGNVYTTGSFNVIADFDPGINTYNLNSVGSTDIFISKLDNTGNFVWAKKMGGTSNEVGNAIKHDAAGNIYITGYFTGAVDFDPGVNTFNLISAGGSDVFMTKFNGAGNLIWAKGVGGGFTDIGNSLALDSQGNVYTTGVFEGTADFDPNNGVYTRTSQGMKDIFMSKLDNSGNFIWAKTMGGTADDIGISLALDPQGNICTTGYFQDSVDFDPGIGTYPIISAGVYDIFISKLSASGNFIWTGAMGGIGQDQGNSLSVDVIGNIFTTGSYEDTVDFDPDNGIFTLNSAGNNDIFVHKMICKTSYDTLTISACDFYTANGQTYTMSGNYTQTLITAFGCDSILILNLSINHSNYDTLIQTTCDSATINGQSFTSSGTYTQTLINALGCDSTLTLNLTINHSTDSTLNQIACDTFAFNGQTYSTSGNYPHYFTNSHNCDSIVYLNLTISNIGTDTLIETACQYYTLNAQTYTSSGIYTQAIAGCDSAITLMLTINTPTTGTTTQTACNSYTLNGQTYYSSGVYQQALTNAQGCDSLLTLNLTINNSTDTLINQTACNSLTFTLNGQTYTASGIYTQILTNAAGCDSLITLNLSLNYTTYDTLTQTACGAYTINGQTYTTSGIYTQTLTNSAGCDSVLTINLTLVSNDSSSFYDYGCDVYSWGNQNYTTSGIYTQTFTNTTGCDSLVTLNLNLGYTQHLYNNLNACNSYICHGITHYTDGDCDSTYIDSLGCVTHITTSYYISWPAELDDFITSCGPYSDPHTGQTYYTSSNYDWLDPSWGICGIIYHVDLWVIYIDTSITRNGNTLISNESGAIYWWHDCSNGGIIPGATNQSFTPSQNGSYAVEIQVGGFFDGCYGFSNCYTILNAGVDDYLFSKQVKAYPNPTTGILTIDVGAEYEIAEVKITSLIGQQLFIQKYKYSQLLAIEMPELKGVYFVSVKLRTGEEITRKVVKE